VNKKYDTSTWPLLTTEAKARDPKKIKLLTICDPHLSAHNPPSYKVEYWPLLKKTIDYLNRWLAVKELDAVLWAGDIFHLKSAQRNPHWFMAETIELLSSGVRNLAIAGNHDTKYGNIETGLEGQPLEILIAARTMQLLDREEHLISGEDGLKVRIAGASYHHGKADGPKNKKKRPGEILVTLGHFWFGPQSGIFYGEPIYGPEFFRKSETDVYVIGHHHEDQGHQTENGKHFVALGSLTRTGAHKHDLERRPAAGLIEITKDGVQVTALRPNLPPAGEVMDLEKRKQITEEKKEMELFIASLRDTTLTAMDPKEILKELEAEEETRARTLRYIEEAEDAAT